MNKCQKKLSVVQQLPADAGTAHLYHSLEASLQYVDMIKTAQWLYPQCIIKHTALYTTQTGQIWWKVEVLRMNCGTTACHGWSSMMLIFALRMTLPVSRTRLTLRITFPYRYNFWRWRRLQFSLCRDAAKSGGHNVWCSNYQHCPRRRGDWR